MTAISYEDGLCRLRITGPCASTDAAAVQDAVTSYGAGVSRLTIDLTAVADVAPEVVAGIADAVRDLDEGCQVTVLRKSGTRTDELLRGRAL